MSVHACASPEHVLTPPDRPSVAGPNEGNKMEIRLHPPSTAVSTDIPFKAFARSPNARLGGCMHLDLAAVDTGMAEIRFTSLALVLEQRCRLASVRCACPFSLAMRRPSAHI